MELRDYQESTVQASLAYIGSKEKRPGVIVAPTAAGKSWEIAAIAKRYPHPILVLQPSIELLKQNHEKFTMMGGKASIYSDGAKSKEIGHVTYSILQGIKDKAELFREAGVGLVIIDECHHGISPDATSMFSKFIKKLNPKKVIGLTATPFRLKNNIEGSRLVMLNRMRPGYFRHFIHVTQIQEMIDRGYWSESVDEKWYMDEDKLVLNTTGSEFTEDSIRQTVKENGINNEIYLNIREILKSGSRKHILVFADSLESCEKFCEHIPESDFLSSKFSDKRRAKVVEDFKSGDIKVLFNYGILGTGFDFPELDCIIIGRPTNSLAIFYQIYGRGVRVCESKDDFLFIDYCNNFERLGHPRNLSIEDFPGHGWGVFDKDRLVSSVYLNGPAITKLDLEKSNQEVDFDMKFPFGKHKNKTIISIYNKFPGYVNFILAQDWLDDVFRKKVTEIVKYAQTEKLKSQKNPQQTNEGG